MLSLQRSAGNAAVNEALEQRADQVAAGEVDRMMAEARSGKMSPRQFRRKQADVEKIDKLLERTNLTPVEQNRIKGDYNELLTRSREVRTDEVQYRAEPAGGKKAVAVESKSDRVHRMDLKEAKANARRYRQKAIEDAPNRAHGRPVVIKYTQNQDPEIQQAMAEVFFSEGSPVTEVHFGTTVYRRP
ncbi:hypothetical protein [Actinoplanes sp. NPDC026623]|uniref:hypothetical protein n=1 Tax=Actinoplanes sp. NPDC026623 TaxID=3155610 RepID=UPI003400593C